MVHFRGIRRQGVAALASTFVLAGLLAGVAPSPSAAAATTVRGSACSYYVNVGLFGGEQQLRGCGTSIPTTDLSYAPSVTLPAAGSATAIAASDPDGAKAVYGPATIHGGNWPENVAAPNISGPQAASTQGTPAGGVVTSSADITLRPQPWPAVPCEPSFAPPCLDPGGYGPFPVWGDSVHAECTATQNGISGSTTLSRSFVAKATDGGGAPLPSATEAIPDNPPVNFTRSGVITNVGDVFTVVYNEHIVNPDGSLTVNGMHMYLFGPVAVGEVVRGQVTCGTDGFKLPTTDTKAPTCDALVVAQAGPSDPRFKWPYTQLSGVFDAGGLQSITNVQVTNGTVSAGSSDPNARQYVRFTPGQTGPLPVTAVRQHNRENFEDPTTAEFKGLTMLWSFDATDMAGNTTHCEGIPEQPPTVRNDAYRTPKGKALTVPATPGFGGPTTGLLANDVDMNGNHIVAGSPSTPAHGSVSLSADGSFTYTPAAGFTGYDSFTYVVTDTTGGGGSSTGTVTIRVGVAPTVDFDADGGTEIGVFRPGGGTWFLRGPSFQAVPFGTSGDIPVAADYDFDGKADRAVFRPSAGTWFAEGRIPFGWGTNGDIPVVGDFTGDTHPDRGVFRPSTGVWYIHNGTTTAWGTNGDVPVPGDYDGDGKADVAVFRPSNGAWYVKGSAGGLTTTAWGTNGDIPVPFDYDNNGTTDIAVFRPSSGAWFVRNGATTAWGTNGDIPVPGDYDNNGSTDIAVFRPSSGTWFVQGGMTAVWGTAGDVPISLQPNLYRLVFPG